MFKPLFKKLFHSLVSISSYRLPARNPLNRAWLEEHGIISVAIAVLSVSISLLGIRQAGKLQAWELLAYDQLVRWRRDQETDPRLLIITITEADLRRQQQWPLNDQIYAELLAKLQAFQPRVIGLDIYRDFPVEPGYQQLVKQLRQSNIIAIRSIDTLIGTPAPKAIKPEQVGFNEFPVDPDGIVRRALLYAEATDGIISGFALQLAIAYLQAEGIKPEASKPEGYLQLGKAIFKPLQPDSGAYQKIDTSGYQILLNYRHHQQIAPKISLSEVLEDKIEPNWVKNKVILIGSTAPSLKDSFFTPYSRDAQSNQKMYGVEIHAQIVSQILDAATGKGQLWQFWRERSEKIWIVGWICVGGIVAWYLRHPLILSSGIVISLGLLLGTTLVFFVQGWWLPLSAPSLGFLITLGIVVSYQSYQDHQQQQIVMKILGQNTSPEIAQALWKGRDRLLTSGKLPGELLTATIMFLDLKGFSTIAETMPPDQLLNWLNQMLDMISHEVIIHHGIINKFTGDGVMAVFGVPIPSQSFTAIASDAQKCVNCALAIGDRLEIINQEWQKQSLPTVQMRIGIFTGAVVVGSLGGKDRLEYGVIGDSVNTASRLESCAKERQPSNCRILIAQQTLDYLEDKFSVEAWGAMALKGKAQTVEVYRVLFSKL